MIITCRDTVDLVLGGPTLLKFLAFRKRKAKMEPSSFSTYQPPICIP